MTTALRMTRQIPAACLLVLIGAAALFTAASAADAPSVRISMFPFTPGTLTVPVGTKVTWTNRDEEPHTVFSLTKAFQSDALDTDQSFSFTFDKPGTYNYICTIHPNMKGTITVLPKS
jgi:plastocyanin